MDFRKAQDSTWREELFKKFSEYGVSTNFVSLMKNMSEKIKLIVRLPRAITEIFPSDVGLKQGSNMIPMLFNLFINNINKYLMKVSVTQLI